MQRKRRMTPEFLILLLAMVFRPSTSYAYLDPGTGSYGFQMLLAVGLVLFFGARVYWKKSRAKSSPEQANGGSPTTETHES